MLNHQKICELIPHAGEMCLLNTVKKWDELNILCTSKTHLNKNNPLRASKGLPMLALLEYGAQAMAVHGSLLTKKTGILLKEGYLAAIRDVHVAQGWLSDIEDELEISAERIYTEESNMIYTLAVYAGNTLLVSGRATVIAKFGNRASVL